MLRPTAHDGCSICKEHLAIRTAQGTLDLVCRAIHCLEGFIEASVVTNVCALLSSYCEVGPPLVLDVLKLALVVATNATEDTFFTGQDG